MALNRRVGKFRLFSIQRTQNHIFIYHSRGSKLQNRSIIIKKDFSGFYLQYLQMIKVGKIPFSNTLTVPSNINKQFSNILEISSPSKCLLYFRSEFGNLSMSKKLKIYRKILRLIFVHSRVSKLYPIVYSCRHNLFLSQLSHLTCIFLNTADFITK